MATNFTITENVTRSIQEDTSTYQAHTTPRMEMDETSVPVPTNYDNLSKDLFNCSGNFTNQTEFGTNMAPQSCLHPKYARCVTLMTRNPIFHTSTSGMHTNTPPHNPKNKYPKLMISRKKNE
jgi:hypothetical protein